MMLTLCLFALLLQQGSTVPGRTGAVGGGGGGSIAFVQTNQNITYPSSSATLSTTFSSTQTLHNFNIVAIFWKQPATASIADTFGNTYVDCGAGKVFRDGGGEFNGVLQVFVAKNIGSQVSNQVTATFSVAVNQPSMYIFEYSNGNLTNPVDQFASGFATSGTSITSGNATTTTANELLFAFAATDDTNGSAGTGYTARNAQPGDGTCGEEKSVSSTGTYNAAVNLSTSITLGAIILVTFK